MKKISEWLTQINGHSALDVSMSKEDFEKETGKPWPEWVKGTPVKKMLAQGKKDFKGLQRWDGAPNANVTGGWVVATTLAKEYANFYPHSIGRGSAFWECVEALREAGF